MRSSSSSREDEPGQYVGSEWDKTINNPDHPNFWKFGLADLIFLDHVREKKHVLDLGCGTGGATLFLASEGKAQLIVGVDVNRSMIEVAKKNAAERGLGNRTCFVVCDGRRLPFKSRFLEGLVSRGDAFCFLVPLKATVQELKRIMKPGGVIVLEVDNRVEWKPGTTISRGFTKMRDGRIAYVITGFTKKRNYTSVSYVLDPEGKIVRDITRDQEFINKGHKPSKCPLERVRKETIEIKRSALTHWPTRKGLTELIKKGGFAKVQVIGDGLLMNLLVDGDSEIVRAMKENPQMFFRLERKLVSYVCPDKAPTMILLATAT